MAYSRQNFQDGQILNAANLEAMENGIIAAQNPRNLLDNSDFSNPVAQPGLNGTHGSTVYAVDRWIANGCTAEQSTGCLKLTTSRAYAHILQKVTGVAGKTLTCAARFSSAGVGSIRVYDESISTRYAELKNISAVGCVTFTVPNDVDTISVLLYPNQLNVASGLIYWAALYEGAYTADTLPPYVPKGIMVEMINCGVPLQPPNLLDDSNFVNSVNQRGATSYSGNVYTIDRWRLNANTLNVGSNGITIVAGDSSSAVLTQYTSGLRDGVYTQALNVNGTIYTRMIQLSGSTITTLDASNAAYTGGYVSCTVSGSGYFSFQIRANAGYSITVRWAALYEGAYTADTLPPYVPKGYAEELAECRLYYKVIDVNVAPWMSESTTLRRYYVGYEPMRTVPTADVSGLKEYATWTDLASTMNPYNIKNNRVLISATAETTSTRIYMGGSIALSADL